MMINVMENGRIEGYLSVNEYAKEIGTTVGNVRAMIGRGQLEALTIQAGDGRQQRFNFIKEGTPKPTRSNRRKREND